MTETAKNIEFVRDLMTSRFSEISATFDKIMVGGNIGGLLICLSIAEKHVGPGSGLPPGIFYLAIIFFLGAALAIVAFIFSIFAHFSALCVLNFLCQ